MTNDDLIIDVLVQLERDPATWNQGKWAMRTECGTSYCFAGWALVPSDVELAWQQVENGWDEALRTVTGSDVNVAASKLLGLDGEQAYGLFHPANDLRTLYYRAAQAMGVEPEVLKDKVQDRLGATA